MDDNCRSISPSPGGEFNGVPCIKPRGHKSRKHSNPLVQKQWTEGFKKKAEWVEIDDGYMTEADWLTWGRYS